MKYKLEVIDFTHISKRYPYCGYLEVWNPSPQDLIALIPFLEQNKKIAIVWLCGEAEHIPDFSGVDHYRINKPIYLAKTLEEAYNVYSQIRTEFFDYLFGRVPWEVN